MKALIIYSRIETAKGQNGRIEEISTLEEIIELTKKEGFDVIISKTKWRHNVSEFGDYDIELEVYNDYRE